MQIKHFGSSIFLYVFQVNKSLGEVQKYSFPQLVALDQAVAKVDPAERSDLLGATVNLQCLYNFILNLR